MRVWRLPGRSRCVEYSAIIIYCSVIAVIGLGLAGYAFGRMWALKRRIRHLETCRGVTTRIKQRSDFARHRIVMRGMAK